MDIDNLTLRQIREIKRLIGSDNSPEPFKIGKSYLFRLVTHYWIGRIEAIYATEIEIADAAWIPDTGRFSESIKNGSVEEAEPIADHVVIGRGAIVDCCAWTHPIPNKVK